MKFIFFKNLARGFVVAGAIMALVNCDSSTAANDNQNTADPTAVAPMTDNPTNPVNNPVIDPATGLPADPALNPTDPAQQGTDPAVNPDDPWADPCVASSLPNACGDEPVHGLIDTVLTPASSSSEGEVGPGLQSSSSEIVEESSSSEAPAVPKIFLANDKEEEKNYMEVEYKTNTGWDGEGILAYPKRLTDNPDQKHAIVVWGPGGGTKPSAYEGMIRRLASHGFVVIALKESPGNATQAIKALDWLDGLNKDSNSPLFGKLDMNTVGCSGHSMGGLESEQALIKDRRVLTAFLNNSGDWGGAGAMKVATDRTIAILYGEGGMERGNAENDYNNANVKAPACLIQMTGGKGNECYEVSPGRRECGYGHGSGSWDGMAATVAWMRWHLGGEDFRKADFVGMSGKYIDGNIIGSQGKWKGQCKNF